MREVIQTFTATHEPATMLAVAARHDLEWEREMNKVLKEFGEGTIDRKDKQTVLYPFMLAAVGMEGQYNNSFDKEKSIANTILFTGQE